jgi:hypothetical protein
MDALRSGIRRLVAGARRTGQTGRSVDISDPRNVVVSVNDRPGSVSAVSSQQTVVRQGGSSRTHTTRSSRTTQSSTQGEDDERSS